MVEKKSAGVLTVHVVSDSLGTTARGVVNSAAVQFPHESVRLNTLSKVETIEQVRAYLDRYVDDPAGTAVFHTILSEDLRKQVLHELQSRKIASIDLLGPTMQIISSLTMEESLNVPGLVVDRDVVETHIIDARTLA